MTQSFSLHSQASYMGLTLDQCFEAQHQATPDAPALVYGAAQLTYRQLSDRANQLAAFLAAKGIGQEHIVGICLDRSIEMVVAILATLKAGGAYLPLDPHYPAERLRAMIDDARPTLVLTTSRLRPQGLEDSRIVCLDQAGAAIAAARGTVVSPSTDQHVAYMIYTSGSTGRPKGVMISHSAIVNHMRWIQAQFNWSSSDIFLQKTSFSFDAAVWEFFAPFFCGGSLIMAEPGLQQNAEALIASIRRHQVTVLQVVPSLLRILVEDSQFSGCTSLSHLFCGGEALAAELAAQALAALPAARVYNLYGPTEATIDATFAEASGAERTGSVAIGRPISNVAALVLDASLRPVPAGESGELYLAGAGLARGYYNNPAATAASFLPNPWSQEPGARMYKTGDLVRADASGALHFISRNDDQVKVRGFRIELGEIAACLAAHPGIAQGLVVQRPAPTGDSHIVAYFSAAGQAPGSADLRAALKATLPEHMIPAAFVELAAFPLLPNGKINRAALPAPQPGDYGASSVAPRNELEAGLAELWKTLLKLPEVGIHDRFFDLGGHSLLATQLVARIREQFQVRLPLSAVFESATIAELAAAIATCEERFVAAEAVIPPASREAAIPLTFMQERVWFLHQLAPASLAYNFQMSIRLTGDLRVDLLERALNEVVRRHEILRTTFHATDGQPYQRIHQPWQVVIGCEDLRAIAVDQREAALAERIAASVRVPFDIARLPLARWQLFQLGEREHVLLQMEHHFVHDGWSIAVLLDEVKQLYTSYVGGRPAQLAELPIQYADFAVWQRQRLAGWRLNREVAHWVELLRGCQPTLALPTDKPRPHVQSMRGAAHRIAIPAQLAESVREFSRRNGTTLFITLLTAFNTLLYRYTQQTDIVLGSGVANRQLGQTEALIGMFVNTIVFRTDVSGNPSFGELLRRVHKASLDVYNHLDVPIEQVVDALGLKRDLSRNPLFQAMFSFHDAPVPVLEMPDLRGAILEHNNGSAKADLNVIVIPYAEQQGGANPQRDKSITMIWEYSTDLFAAPTVARMVGHFLTLLEALTADPTVAIDRVPLLSADERAAVLALAQGPARPIAARPLDVIVAEQARVAPDRLAVVSASQQISYRELDAWAERIAAALRSHGVQAGAVAAIYAQRSAATVAAILGVLKAGAAYVPIDPAYPAERAEFILHDSQAAIVLGASQTSAPSDLVSLDPADLRIGAPPSGRAGASLGAEAAAYMIYTSGSTGQPKGVCCSHAGVVNLLADLHERQPLPGGAGYALWTSLTFDVSIYELFAALCYGGTLHICSEEIRADTGAFIRWLRDSAVASAYVPPFMLSELADRAEKGEELALRRMLVGVEPIPQQVLERIQANIPGLRIINGYGPTETAICATLYTLPEQSAASGITPIGRPVQNTSVYVLDQELQPVPAGISGEIYIGGPGLAQAYQRRPALTAGAFIPDPFSSAPGQRLYRTGDRGRYRASGELEFLGRGDTQIKLRGLRIEQGEIEASLRRHPEVGDAVVIARDDVLEGSHLVAYVTARAGAAPDQEGLRAFLKGILPAALIPSLFVSLDHLPLTSHGKIDRGALPRPDVGHCCRAVVPAATATERRLLEIWQNVLGAADFSADQSFFEVGGHSLLATRVAARIQNEFHKRISVSSMFEYPTIIGMGGYIDSQAEPLAENVGGPAAGEQLLHHMLGALETEDLETEIATLSADEVELLIAALGEGEAL